MIETVFGITGPQHAGKTTSILALSAELVRFGIDVVGVAQPAVWQADILAGYDVLDLATGDRQSLVNRSEDGSWRFFQDGFDWAGRVLQAGLGRRSVPVLVVDELGKLEAEGLGHYPALERAFASDVPQVAVLSIRQDRTSFFEDRFHIRSWWEIGGKAGQQDDVARWAASWGMDIRKTLWAKATG
ncbi:MAG: DUF2478 domain-containing protein [Deltaproteobacteria bacterium]|nr:DUF2478 domain-containing protein [Deltaproteobacteria bacterium]